MPHELDRWVRRKVRRRNDERPRTRRGGCGAHHEVDGGAPPLRTLFWHLCFRTASFFFICDTARGGFQVQKGGDRVA